MSFDDDLFHFEVQQVVEKDRNNLIDFRLNHRDEIASFLKSHFYDVNEVEKRDSLNIDLYFLEFLLNLSCSFNELTLTCFFIHYFD